MRYSRCISILGMATSLCLALGDAMAGATSSPLRMTVECKSNPDCRYTGKGIPVLLKVANVSQENIFLTAAYMQKAGPYITVRDRRTNRLWYGDHRLGTEELLSNYLSLGPGETTVLTYTLYREDVGIFAKGDDAVDVTVEFEYSGYWFGTDRQLKSFDEKATVTVSSAKTAQH